MSWMDFILDLAELCIWPITLVACLFLLRSPLSLLLPFTQSIKYKHLELQFSQELNLANEHAHAALPNFKQIDRKQELLNNSEHLPNHSILAAWSALDMNAKNLLLNSQNGIQIPEQQSYKFVGKALSEHALITDKQAKLFHELRQLRNKVAHAANYDVNTLLAKQYIEMCFALIEELKLLEDSKATPTDKAST